MSFFYDSDDNRFERRVAKREQRIRQEEDGAASAPSPQYSESSEDSEADPDNNEDNNSNNSEAEADEQAIEDARYEKRAAKRARHNEYALIAAEIRENSSSPDGTEVVSENSDESEEEEQDDEKPEKRLKP